MWAAKACIRRGGWGSERHLVVEGRIIPLSWSKQDVTVTHGGRVGLARGARLLDANAFLELRGDANGDVRHRDASFLAGGAWRLLERARSSLQLLQRRRIQGRLLAHLFEHCLLEELKVRSEPGREGTDGVLQRLPGYVEQLDARFTPGRVSDPAGVVLVPGVEGLPEAGLAKVGRGVDGRALHHGPLLLHLLLMCLVVVLLDVPRLAVAALDHPGRDPLLLPLVAEPVVRCIQDLGLEDASPPRRVVMVPCSVWMFRVMSLRLLLIILVRILRLGLVACHPRLQVQQGGGDVAQHVEHRWHFLILILPHRRGVEALVERQPHFALEQDEYGGVGVAHAEDVITLREALRVHVGCQLLQGGGVVAHPREEGR
mmetsp:Transcript_25203/g.74980  ORF Transcript_25203/g.74980 Transcript_25203/m.74980 type:complete len:372 (-) Transcript_25203:1542-2657(-)